VSSSDQIGDSSVNGPRLVLDLGGTCVRTAVVDASGAIAPGTRKTEKVARTITTRVGLRDLIVDTIVSGGISQRDHVLSLAGPISPDNRVIRKYTNVLKDDFDIPVSDMVEQDVRRRTGKAIRFFVIKDAVAASMAEMSPAGAAAGRDEVIALILGTGTGGAPCRRGPDGVISFPTRWQISATTRLIRTIPNPAIAGAGDAWSSPPAEPAW
jgi:predicted NBD/HSP70 family sugar kinase